MTLEEWWNKNKDAVVWSAKCFMLGAAVGFVRGMVVQSKITNSTMNRLIESIPYTPAPDDIPLEKVLEGCSKADIIDLCDLMIKDGLMTP